MRDHCNVEPIPDRADLRDTHAPAKPPKATLVLIPGGHGGLQLFPNGSMKWGENNFLVRTRRLFADQGFTVVIVDAPSDRQ